ncbi:MAG: hypothetical protein ABIB71_08615 [Candidatus Woesearchaeota archaeon]
MGHVKFSTDNADYTLVLMNHGSKDKPKRLSSSVFSGENIKSLDAAVLETGNIKELNSLLGSYQYLPILDGMMNASSNIPIFDVDVRVKEEYAMKQKDLLLISEACYGVLFKFGFLDSPLL